MSEGTRVFIRNGPLWDNRVEDASGWFFTRAGDAYAAIRVAEGYTVTTRTYIWPDRKLQEVEEKNGHYLELKDMWAPDRHPDGPGRRLQELRSVPGVGEGQQVRV